MYTVHECDRRTDRRTEFTITTTAQRIASRGKNHTSRDRKVGTSDSHLFVSILLLLTSNYNFAPANMTSYTIQDGDRPLLKKRFLFMITEFVHSGGGLHSLSAFQLNNIFAYILVESKIASG